MNRLVILAVLLAVFSSPSFAKEKETFIALGGSLKCLHTDGTVRDGACDCMPDSPGSCANTVGADGAGMAPPVKASVKSAYVHRPDSTQYHPEGEGGTKPKPASVGRAYEHRPDRSEERRCGKECGCKCYS